MDIINFSKSDLGIAIAWLATVLSLGLSIWAIIFSKAVQTENNTLNLKIEKLNSQINHKQKIGDENISQTGEKNVYVKKNTGGLSIK